MRAIASSSVPGAKSSVRCWMTPFGVRAENGETPPAPRHIPRTDETTECAEVFEDFLKYLYSEEIALNLQNVWPIILLADKYMVSALRQVCVDFLKRQLDHISLEELWLVMKNAESCLVEEVKNVALRGLRANFMHFTLKMMMKIAPTDILMLLDSSDVVAEDEFQLWLKLRQYLAEMKKDKSYPNDIFQHLIKLVRLHQMSASQLNIVAASDFMTDIYRVHGERAMEQALLYRAQFAEECTSKLPKGIPPPRLYLHNAHFLKYNLHSSHIGYKRMLKKPEPVKLMSTVSFFRDVQLVFYVSEHKPYLCQKGVDGASSSPWTFRPIFTNVPKSETKKMVTFVFLHEADQCGWPYKIVMNVEDEKNRRRGTSRVKVVSGVVEKGAKGKSPEVRVSVPGSVHVEGEKGLSAHLMVYMYVPHGKSLRPTQGKVWSEFDGGGFKDFRRAFYIARGFGYSCVTLAQLQPSTEVWGRERSLSKFLLLQISNSEYNVTKFVPAQWQSFIEKAMR
ncbi:hypothetical protein BSL78_25532 [Apostichopus japonicus]|uniref:BTB domain-containing protein n=1 Tax=Stichopus japonicus TaxID=307972 RepID=A0A2G8JPK4_STIJA|nr:hypothetical protein BSL78_25532 [Apostichopus japonicus]